ncbi:MAG: flagellar basal-body rod protein FlgG [Acidaminobacteraceae bacterium]
MKAMWAAASGMKSLQHKIDTISNNLANVNTTGFKKQRIEFKDLLYEKLQSNQILDGDGRPTSIEIGQGVLTSSTTRSFGVGNMEATNNDLDVAINGSGFFAVLDAQGETRYTKDGSFKLGVDDTTSQLVTADGYKIQGSGGNIELGESVAKVDISKAGEIVVTRTTGEKETVAQLELFSFANPSGLESIGSNLYKNTPAAGTAVSNQEVASGEIWQGFLESSNVQVVDEMINMITAQRAYEINSKTIQTGDKLLELANNLRR